LLLQNGADPTIKNSYNKNAIDLAQDELDAANKVVTSKAEIRSVLEEWDANQSSSLFGTGKQMKTGGAVEREEALPKDGTGVAMQVEMAKDKEAKAKEKTAKAQFGAGKHIKKKKPPVKKK
jgi:hypothetical protein